jgi:hypothetical protein
MWDIRCDDGFARPGWHGVFQPSSSGWVGMGWFERSKKGRRRTCEPSFKDEEKEHASLPLTEKLLELAPIRRGEILPKAAEDDA